MLHHEKYMSIALQQAKQALDAGDFPVGCVMVYQNKIVSSGKRQHSSVDLNELDHAEMVALRELYNNNDKSLDMGKVTVYSTMEPCLMCFSTLIVNGIRNVIYGYEDVMGGGTNLPLSSLAPLYTNLKITTKGNVLRNASLALFKEFFSSPDNTYLQNSMLARYTLEQN